MTLSLDFILRRLFIGVGLLFFAQFAPAQIRDGGINPKNMGKGEWIYSMKDATNRLGGHISSVTNEVSLMKYYKSIGIRYMIIKMGTSAGYYSGCYASPHQVTANLCNIGRTNGVWIFGYTRSYGEDVAGESALADSCFNNGADGFVFDAEAEWESNRAWIGTNGPALAWQLCSMVRSNWPNKFLGHAPFPIISFHSSFPYKEFGYWCDAVMPQIYHFSQATWPGLKGSPSASINWSDVNWRVWQNSLIGSSSVINGQTIYWTNAIKPILPLQDVYGESGNAVGRCNGTVSAQLAEDVMEFIDYSTADPNCITATGYKGVNFWRADLHGTNQFAFIAAGTSGDFSNVINNIVIDDAHAAVVGAWGHVRTFAATTTLPTFYGETTTDTNSFGTNYWRKTQGTGTAYMQFTPKVLTPGDYNIYQWHPNRTDASTNVPFVVNHSSGSTVVYANQRTNSGNWSFLGRFPFAAGTNGNIRVMDNFSEAGAVALVDGLKMVYASAGTVPAAPGLLTASAVSSSQINLSWKDNSTNESAFVVSRSTVSGGPYSDRVSLAANVTNYSDVAVLAGATYHYIVRATNSLGSSTNSNQASATTPGSSAPAIATQPQTLMVGVGTNANFSVSATGTAPLAYQWRFNGNTIALATGNSYTVTRAKLSDAGSYSVTVQNGFGTTTSSNAVLRVITAPTISAQPQNLVRIAGATASFSVTANGTNLVFQWRKNGATLSNGGRISGATAATLQITNVAQTDAASYSIVISNLAGSVTSANATLTVLDPPGILEQPQNQTIALGTDVTFSVSAAGTPPLNYQWRFNNTPVPNANSSSFSLSSVQFSDAGLYSVVITNNVGSTTSSNATLTVLTTLPGVQITNIWNIQAGSRLYVTSNSTERGLCLNPSTGHVLLVSRSSSVAGNLGIFILNAETGIELGLMNTNAITNTATFKLNKIDAADNGVIYAANMTTASSTSPFVIYRWASESAVPTIAYSGAPDGGTTARWGDSFAVKGSGVNTRILVSSSGANSAILFTTTDGINFVPTKLNPSPAISAGEFSRGLYFGADNTFYIKNRSIDLAEIYSYTLGGDATFESSIAPLDFNFLSIAVATNMNLLAGISDDNSASTTGHKLLIYEISNLASPVVISNFPFLPFGPGVNSANPNFAGSVDTDGSRFVALDTQNGVVAVKFSISQPAPHIDAFSLLPANKIQLDLNADPGSFAVQASSDFLNWIDITNIIRTNGYFQIIDPSTASPRFYRTKSQ